LAHAEEPGLLWQLQKAGESGDDLRDQVVTMLLAGHETTALALTWTWHHVATRPGVDARLHAASQSGDTAHVRAVVEEAMRLQPPGWILVRKARADDELGGHGIPAGSDVIVSPYVLHRHPAHWPEPLAFRPERFLGAARAAITPFAYVPFGGGPRSCIGSQLALLEAEAVVSTLALRLRFEPAGAAATAPEPIPQLTLKPRRGMPLRIRCRLQRDGLPICGR
jgi:cytochrome P450